jgi:hypothetical protein
MSTGTRTACCATGCLSSDTSCTLPNIRQKEAQVSSWGGILRKVLADKKAKMKSIRGFNRLLYLPFVLLDMSSPTSNFRLLHKCHVQKFRAFFKCKWKAESRSLDRLVQHLAQVQNATVYGEDLSEVQSNLSNSDRSFGPTHGSNDRTSISASRVRRDSLWEANAQVHRIPYLLRDSPRLSAQMKTLCYTSFSTMHLFSA